MSTDLTPALSKGEGDTGRNTVFLTGDIQFKLRFNTAHGDTDWYWRVIINEQEYLARSLQCKVETYSESSFDKKANAIKYHMAGRCSKFNIDENGNAVFV